jgi:hypothetical protein
MTLAIDQNLHPQIKSLTEFMAWVVVIDKIPDLSVLVSEIIA